MNFRHLWSSCTLIFFLSPMIATAQDHCGDILRAGFYDKLTTTKSASEQEAFRADMCSSTYSQAKSKFDQGKTSSNGTNVGGTYAGYGLSFGSTNSDASFVSDSTFNQWKTSNCSNSSSESSRNAADFLMQETVDSRVVDAWKSCMQKTQGLSCYASPPKAGSDLVIGVNWYKLGVVNTEATVLNSTLSKHATSTQSVPAGMLLANGHKLLGELVIPVTWDDKTAVTATVNVDNQGVSSGCEVYVPPVNPTIQKVDACKVVSPLNSLDTMTPQTAEISQGDQIFSPNLRYSLGILKSGEVELCERDFNDQCKCNKNAWRSNTGVTINQLLRGNQILNNKLVMQKDGNVGIYIWTTLGKSTVICASGSNVSSGTPVPQGHYMFQMNDNGTVTVSGPTGNIWTSNAEGVRGFTCASQTDVDHALQ